MILTSQVYMAMQELQPVKPASIAIFASIKGFCSEVTQEMYGKLLERSDSGGIMSVSRVILSESEE